MDIRKTVKKIAALVAGTTMLGATIMGAMALDLSDYPAPFVANGVFDGKIVVGANAATSDVVGAIDLAASLQAEAATTTEISIPGAAGTAVVTGDSAEFRTGSDIVRIGETIGSVKSTFTDIDLDALSDGVFDTGLGSTPVEQYLKFDNTTASVVYEETDDDVVADFLKFSSDSYMFEYHLAFTEGAVSEVGSTGALDDFENEILTILGAPFTIVEAKLDATDGTRIDLTMLGGEVADVLRDGETKTYTIDGKDYEVTAVFIDSTASTAKLSVNGLMTKELAEGKTEVLGADVTVGIQAIMTNQREGLVEFYLGANKIKLTDSNYADTAYAAGTVKVGTETISDAYLIVKATNQTGSELKLNYIKYKVQADDDYWVAADKDLGEFLTEPEAMLTDTWDIYYAGLMETGVSTIKWNSKSDHSYKFEFENVNGDEYSFPLITNKNGIYKWGDDDDHFVFFEPTYGNATCGICDGTTGFDNSTFISDNDYFIVSDRATSATEDKAVSSILRYQSLNTGDTTVTFKDLAGDSIVVSYTGTLGAGATGELIVAGASHNFYIGASSATASEKYALAMDLDGSGAINDTELKLVARGGAIVDFGAQTFGAADAELANLSAAQDMTIVTPASQFDESADGPETSTVRVNESSTDKMTATVTSPSLVDDPDDDDWGRAYSNYGAFFERYAPTTGSAIPEVTVSYPLVQRGAQVFVTAGVVQVTGGAATGGGSIESTAVNPIAVGLAVLDTDAPAVGTENMIAVGGPCANTVAAELMGNPENCAEGFEPGKAIIKLFDAKNALLVAGYEAQETLGACYVLADYEDYALSGTEVEVVVADLATITVNPVS